MTEHPGAVAPAVAAAALGRAWALKDAAYAAWSSDPGRAAAAAAELLALAESHPGEPLIAALARWTDGIAALAAGEMARALAALDDAEAALAAHGQPLAAAQTRVPCIVALAMLGRHAESVACAEAARERLQALGDTTGAAKVSLNLAALHIRRNEAGAAIGHARRASALFARSGDQQHSVMADISLADALAASGDFDEAERIHARAADRAARHALPVLQALAEESRAGADLVRGRWRQALAGFEAARRGYAALGLAQHQAIAEKQLADAYLELRLLPEALALFDTAVEHFAALEAPDERAWALLQRALARWQLGQPAAAADLAEAGAVFDALDHAAGAAAVLLARAEVALAAGDEPAAAAALAGDALARGGDDAPPQQRQRAQLALAQALLDGGDVAAAEAVFAAVQQAAAAARLLPQQARAHAGLGAAAWQRGDRIRARREWLAAVELFEAQRDALPGSDFKRAFVADHLRPYHGLLRCALADATPGGAAAAEVLQLLERHRASAGALPGRSSAAGDRAARERLDWLYRRRQQLADEGRHDAQLDAEAQRIEAALLEAARRERMLDATAHDATMPAPGADASGLPDALVAAMQPDQALLVTAVIDDELLAVIARHDGLVLQRRVARSSDVTASIALLRNQLQILAAGSQRFEQHLPQLTQRCRSALQRLAQQLWAPLAPALAGVQRLLLVPHGELAGLPWSALAGGGDAEAPRPLIVHATSARAALRVLGTGSAWHTPRRVLAWGDSKRLQHAAAEAGGVAALYAEGRALLGEQATRQALLEQGPGAEVLHFACHAHFRRDNPAFSALRLTDGELSAEQVGALRLPAALVVLGGCETNRADPGAADDPVGLVQAFLAAGAERVLAAQWPLHDAPGAALLQALHRGLAAGATPAAALDAAMREVARAHPHPALWAALTLHGRW